MCIYRECDGVCQTRKLLSEDPQNMQIGSLISKLDGNQLNNRVPGHMDECAPLFITDPDSVEGQMCAEATSLSQLLAHQKPDRVAIFPWIRLASSMHT